MSLRLEDGVEVGVEEADAVGVACGIVPGVDAGLAGLAICVNVLFCESVAGGGTGMEVFCGGGVNPAGGGNWAEVLTNGGGSGESVP